MKKTLLLGGILAGTLFANAQQRLVLYEEFSGENCGPCAATNPDFWAFMTNSTNQNKAILLKYQVNIPPNSVHPLYDQNATEADARLSYYSVNSAPNGRIDGRVHHPATTSPGHPGWFLDTGGQDTMNTEAAIPSAFNITVTPTVTGNTLNATISVTAASAFTGTTMKLRAALVEGLHYTTPPGNNGEVDFHNVMRKMYPDAAGQTFPATWTSGMTQTFTISGTIPQYVDKAADKLFLIVWIQDDANKKIAQAAKSANLPLPAVDGRLAISAPVNGTLFCGAATPAHKVTLKNTGTTALTSANIHYKIGTAAYQTFAWTGSLAPGASTEVTLGTISVAVGNTAVVDSIGTVNGAVEINPANNKDQMTLTSVAPTSTLPIASGFQGTGFDAGWVVFDGNGKVVSTTKGSSGSDWFAGTSQSPLGPDNSTGAAAAPNFNSDPGYTTVLALPYVNAPAGDKALDFSFAHAKRGTTGDKLDVVYSTDCGATWQSLWSKSGDDLTTAPATGAQNLFVPTPAQWKKASVNVSTVSGNALIGFKSSSNGGNYIFLDQVTLRTGAVTGLGELVSGGTFTLYPNPATDKLNVELNMVKAAKVTFSIVNLVGQQVGQPLVKEFNQGQAKATIATNSLTPGIYFLNVTTEKGSVQQKFVKE